MSAIFIQSLVSIYIPVPRPALCSVNQTTRVCSDETDSNTCMLCRTVEATVNSCNPHLSLVIGLSACSVLELLWHFCLNAEHDGYCLLCVLSIRVHAVPSIYTILDKECLLSERPLPAHSAVSSLLSDDQTYCRLQSLVNDEQTAMGSSLAGCCHWSWFHCCVCIMEIEWEW